jgi:formate dehydrogenase major subunit
MHPNVHIQEAKAATCDVQPGRRPRGKALVEFVEDYRRRAGVPSGIVPVGGRVPVEAVEGGGAESGEQSSSRP